METFSFFLLISQIAPLISVCTLLLQVYQQLKHKLLASHVGVRKPVSYFNSLLITWNFMTAGFLYVFLRQRNKTPSSSKIKCTENRKLQSLLEKPGGFSKNITINFLQICT